MKVKIISNYDESYINMGDSNFSIIHYSDQVAQAMTDELRKLIDSRELPKDGKDKAWDIQNGAIYIASEMAKLFHQIANEASLQQQIQRVLIRKQQDSKYNPFVWLVEFGNDDQEGQIIPLLCEKSISAYIVTDENKTFRKL